MVAKPEENGQKQPYRGVLIKRFSKNMQGKTHVEVRFQ